MNTAACNEEARRLYEQSPRTTLREVGEALGLTAEAVRQRIKKAREREGRMLRIERARIDPLIIATLDDRIAEMEQHIALLIEILAGLKVLRQTDVAIADVEFSTRVAGTLKTEGIEWLSQVEPMTGAELMRCPNFGRKSYVELWHVMVEFGFWTRDDPVHKPWFQQHD